MNAAQHGSEKACVLYRSSGCKLRTFNSTAGMERVKRSREAIRAEQGKLTGGGWGCEGCTEMRELGCEGSMKLRFAGVVVGDLSNLFESDGTWFATFKGIRSAGDNEVLRFIEFCEDWSRRCALDQADAAEFNHYQRFLEPGSWSLEDDSQVVKAIGTPMFFDGMSGEISWVNE